MALRHGRPTRPQSCEWRGNPKERKGRTLVETQNLVSGSPRDASFCRLAPGVYRDEPRPSGRVADRVSSARHARTVGGGPWLAFRAQRARRTQSVGGGALVRSSLLFHVAGRSAVAPSFVGFRDAGGERAPRRDGSPSCPHQRKTVDRTFRPVRG